MIFFSSIENCLVMHHLLNDQICTMVISCHKLDDQVYGIERVVIYRQSLTPALRDCPYMSTYRFNPSETSLSLDLKTFNPSPKLGQYLQKIDLLTFPLLLESNIIHHNLDDHICTIDHSWSKFGLPGRCSGKSRHIRTVPK